VATVLNIFALVAFEVRYSLENVNLPDQETTFRDGRKEMSTKSDAKLTLILQGLLVSLNIFHLLQNLNWVKMLSVSWCDNLMRLKNAEILDLDDDF